MDPAFIIPGNEEIAKHYSDVYSLPDAKSPEHLPKGLIAYSRYQNPTLRQLIRAALSSVANLPTKAIVFLAYDHYFRNREEIAERANALLDGQEEQISPNLVEGYLENAFLKISQKSEGGKEFKPTFLIEPDPRTPPWKSLPRHQKTIDGFLIGDPFAYLGIEISASLNPEIRSGYKILGVSQTPSEISGHETIPLALYWLARNKGLGAIRDFAEEVYFYDPRVTHKTFPNALHQVTNPLKRAEEAGIITLNNNTMALTSGGRSLLEKIDPLFQAIGWHDAQAEDNLLTYGMLDRKVAPNFSDLWLYRFKKLDEKTLSRKGWEELLRMMEAAREKHREDSPRMH